MRKKTKLRSRRPARLRGWVFGGLFALAVLGGWSHAEQADSAALGGKSRCLTHVSTDKPIYRAGETVYVRAVMLDAFDRTPVLEKYIHGLAQVKGPKGDVVASGHVRVQDSVGAFSWSVPDGQAGGEYKVTITYPRFGYTPAERKFDIRAYRAPRLRSQITFVRKGYGPSDEVSAVLETRRAEGGIPAGAKVTVLARLDGREIHRGAAAVDARGRADARFKLPEKIARGEGTLAFVIEDGGVVETAAKTIPILLQTVDMDIYPEGGDLVAGLASRVYIEARRPDKKPADISGIVVDGMGGRVAEFATGHEGRGRFDIKPKAGESYTLKITRPAGITTAVKLPAAKPEGAVLHATKDVYAKGDKVEFEVNSAMKKNGPSLRLVLSQREREIASVPFWTNDKRTIALTPPESAAGVLRATVYNSDTGAPLAERLIYREPARRVRLSIKVDKKRPVPGDRVKVRITATDEKGRPVKDAVVGLTVTDDSVLEMIDKREQAPRLPVMVFLEPEVRELADAHVYLDPGNKDAPVAVDLLLGTQGWRRFSFEKDRLTKFMKEHGTRPGARWLSRTGR